MRGHKATRACENMFLFQRFCKKRLSKGVNACASQNVLKQAFFTNCRLKSDFFSKPFFKIVFPQNTFPQTEFFQKPYFSKAELSFKFDQKSTELDI